VREALSRHVVDVRPLRASPAYRSWWLGSSLSLLGGQLTAYALLYTVWTHTHRASWVGALAVVELVPTVLGALLGGSLADRMDRRRLVVCTRVGQLVASTGLAVAVATGAPLGLVFVLAALLSGFGSAGAPADRSFTARLLPGELLAAGLALSRLAWQVTLLLGPALAGVLTTVVGVQVCFVVDAVTFAGALWGLAALPVMRPERSVGPDLHGLGGAVRLVLGNRVLLGAFATDLAATVLAMPVALFPVINAEAYGGSAITLGLFAPAIGLGGMAAAALSGRVTASARPGRLMLGSAGVWALALGCFGLTRELWLGLLCLAIAGAADTVSVVSRTAIVQHATPDSARGRVNALDYLVGVSGPQLGNFRAGLVASATSGAASAVIGGIASLLAVAAVTATGPSLRRWTTADSVEVSPPGHPRDDPSDDPEGVLT